MATQIFVNLPVKDLKKTMEFFSKLGFSFNPQFTDDNAACMVVDENHIYVMLLVEPFFKTFTSKEIADTTKTAEVILSLSAESRQHVDDMVKKAVDAGGSIPKDAQDYGWMYQHSFQDLDGHLWETAYIDEVAMKEAFANAGAQAQS